MSDVMEVNRELMRLDTELRSGGIDRSMFRSMRRKLLQDFEEKQTTTTPGALSGNEVTIVDGADAPPFTLPPIEPEPAPAAPSRRTPPLGLAALGIGGLVVLAVAAWWVFRPRTELPAAPNAAQATGTDSIAGGETPQSVAAALLATGWAEQDMSDFLQRWAKLSPQAVAAATEDSRIWLLRGETSRRLREAREAESVDHSAQAQMRAQQLEQIQAAISSP